MIDRPGSTRRKRGAASVPEDPASVMEPSFDRRVTALRPVGSEGERTSVIVDRKKVAVVATSDLERLGLVVGVVWSAPVCAAVTEACRDLAATRHAVRLLRARDRASSDLARRLKLAGHEASAIARAVEKLTDKGLVDDARFAEATARALARRGDLGSRAIEAKLRTKGLGSDQARHAARAETRDVNELDRAIAAATKRASRMSSALDEPTRTRRLLGFLARRGFSHEDCRRAVEIAVRDTADSRIE